LLRPAFLAEAKFGSQLVPMAMATLGVIEA
jgi:hypothetical protein